VFVVKHDVVVDITTMRFRMFSSENINKLVYSKWVYFTNATVVLTNKERYLLNSTFDDVNQSCCLSFG